MADNKLELTIIQNTLSLLRKGNFSLTGEEALIFHQCFLYLVDKHKVLSHKPAPIQTVIPTPLEPKKKKNKDV